MTLVRVFSGNVKVQVRDGHHDGPRVKIGGWPLFTCTTTTSGSTVTQWTKGPSQPIKNREKFQLNRDRTALLLKNIQKSDEGQYYCRIQTPSDRKGTRSNNGSFTYNVHDTATGQLATALPYGDFLQEAEDTVTTLLRPRKTICRYVWASFL